MLKETKINDEQKKFIKKIQGSNDKLSKLINESLSLLKAETGHLEIRLEPINFQDIITKLKDKFIPLLVQKNQLLNFNNEFKETINSDSNIILDILSRLIDNASKFASNDTKIHVNIKSNSNKCELSVTNTGDTIKPEVIDKILKPFTLDEEMMNHSKGLGMGLSLCHAYLKNLGSQLQIESKDQQFKVSFTI